MGATCTVFVFGLRANGLGPFCGIFGGIGHDADASCSALNPKSLKHATSGSCQARPSVPSTRFRVPTRE